MASDDEECGYFYDDDDAEDDGVGAFDDDAPPPPLERLADYTVSRPCFLFSHENAWAAPGSDRRPPIPGFSCSHVPQNKGEGRKGGRVFVLLGFGAAANVLCSLRPQPERVELNCAGAPHGLDETAVYGCLSSLTRSFLR
jgi:hypothetical protein